MPDLYRTNVVDLCTERATKTMSEWINVKEYMINLGYGRLQPTRLISKARIDARNQMRELPLRLETPDQVLVGFFYKTIFKGIFNFLLFSRSQDQQPLFNCLTVWILVFVTFIPCPLLVQDCLNYIVWSQIWCRKWMTNFGQMFKIVWTAQTSGKVNYVHSAMTNVNVNMTIEFIECWSRKFRENWECFKFSVLTTAGGKYAKRRWDLLPIWCSCQFSTEIFVEYFGSMNSWSFVNNILRAVMSGTCGLWQFWYIRLCYTLEFWGFARDRHQLFQIPNSSPLILAGLTISYFKTL